MLRPRIGVTNLGVLSAVLLALLTPFLTLASDPPRAGAAPVKLAVLLVFDQLRGDYIARWQSQFGEGGFKRLIREGVWFDQCHYPYASTMTGPGHASIATGCSPSIHGIITNDWYDLEQGASAYCASEARYGMIPSPELKAGDKKPQGGAPTRNLAPSLGDALKTATGNKGRVFALSIKDRSAILPAGRSADACYWFNSEYSRWVTSSFYRDSVHPWVADLNRVNPAEKYHSQVWEKLPGVDYDKLVGPDDVVGEGFSRLGFDRVFPHPIVGDKDRTTKSKNEAVVTTPYGNDLLYEAFEKLVEAEKPGSREVPDFLSLSFSSNDLCGHAFGPDSQEVLDMTLRTDRLIARLLDRLDGLVGKGNYSLALTADHGICPLPEVSAQRGLVARRIDTAALKKAAVDYLRATYPTLISEKANPIAFLDNDLVYFDPIWLKNSGVDATAVAEKLAGWFRKQPGFAAAYTRAYLSQPAPSGASEIELRVRKSWHPERSGHLQLVTAPYHLKTTYTTGTSHGTPHDYDRHVPLMVLAPGLTAAGTPRHDPVTPQAAAVVLAHSLGIAAPARAEVSVPVRLFAR